MGIINLTPDSFSDGGKYNRTAKAEKTYFTNDKGWRKNS